MDFFFCPANGAPGGKLVHTQKHNNADPERHDPREACPQPRFSLVVIPEQEEREEGEEKHPSGKTGTTELSSFQAVFPDNELFPCVAGSVQRTLLA